VRDTGNIVCLAEVGLRAAGMGMPLLYTPEPDTGTSKITNWQRGLLPQRSKTKSRTTNEYFIVNTDKCAQTYEAFIRRQKEAVRIAAWTSPSQCYNSSFA
jgi:hypothetical protein